MEYEIHQDLELSLGRGTATPGLSYTPIAELVLILKRKPLLCKGKINERGVKVPKKRSIV